MLFFVMLSFTEAAQRIFNYGELETCLILGQNTNKLVYRTLFCVIHRKSYPHSKTVRFFLAHPVVYMCQKSLNFTYAFKCYQQNESGFTLAGPPCILPPIIGPMKGFPLEFGIGVRGSICLNDVATRWSKKF